MWYVSWNTCNDLSHSTVLTCRQGKADSFYQQKQLLPENLAAAAKEAGHGGQVKVRYHDGYDHSYFMIASFADDHVEHAAKHLFASG